MFRYMNCVEIGEYRLVYTAPGIDCTTSSYKVGAVAEPRLCTRARLVCGFSAELADCGDPGRGRLCVALADRALLRTG